MEKKYSKLICIISLLVSFILIATLFFGVYALDTPKIQEETETYSSKIEIIENCKGLNLKDTAICLRDSLKPIYTYNKTDDSIKLTFDEMKERGGDCRDWAFLYEELANELELDATTVRNGGVSGLFSAHRYTVIWDEKNYCKLDTMGVRCYKKK